MWDVSPIAFDTDDLRAGSRTLTSVIEHPTPEDIEAWMKRDHPRCVGEHCDRTASKPPCLDSTGKPLCSRCAVIASGGRCTYCLRRFDSAYALDPSHRHSKIQREFAGKALCVACWSGLGYSDPGFTDSDSSVRGSWSGR